MKERPILFSGPMVRAILEGRKTQTRRVINSVTGIGRVTEFQASDTPGYAWTFRDSRLLWNDLTTPDFFSRCPYGEPGDRLWVREAFRPYPPQNPSSKWEIVYAADAASVACEAPSTYMPVLYNYERWYPSIHMPRWACRLVLEITDVSVQRLQELLEVDAHAEGVEHSLHLPGGRTASENFAHLWESINGDGSWESNPWVWVITFSPVRG